MKTKVAVLIHGIGILRKDTGILRKLVPYLEERGYEVKEFTYGFTLFFQTIAKNKEWAKKLARYLNQLSTKYEQVVVIGHSNGCAIMDHASRDISSSCSYVYLAPALEERDTPAPCVQKIHVWFNREDRVLRLTEIVEFIPKWAAKRLKWGKMGIKGYTGKDKRFWCHQIVEPGLNFRQSHAAMFVFPQKYCKQIVLNLERY